MRASIPERPWDTNPEDLIDAGFDDESVEAHAWAEWDLLARQAIETWSAERAGLEEVARASREVAEMHKAIWGRFSRAEPAALMAAFERAEG